MTLTTAFLAHTQSAALAAPSLITATNAGSLLSSTYEPNTIVVSPGSPGSSSKALGAVTLTMESFDMLAPSVASAVTAPVVSTASWQEFSTQTSPVSQVAPVSWTAPESSLPMRVAQDEVSPFDVTPVPESSTCVAALLAACVALYSQRHRLAGATSRSKLRNYRDPSLPGGCSGDRA